MKHIISKSIHFFALVLIVGVLCMCSQKEYDEKFEEGMENIIRFQIDVNTAPLDTPDNIILEKDWAVLILPKSYQEKGVACRMVIYCHSGGGTVSDKGSEAENMDIVKYLVSQGYAILSVAGMPESYSRRLKIDQGRTVGSPVSLRSAVEAYNVVISRYNIKQDGCFLFCNSNGGLQAGNIVNLSDIPILGQSGIAPLVSTELNAWFVSSSSLFEGEFSKYQVRSNIGRIFGMKKASTLEELQNLSYEKEKVGIYDPFDYSINQTTEKYRVPYLIFAFKKDVTIFYNIIEEFAIKLNARGSNIVFGDTEEYGGHNVQGVPVVVGNFNYMGTVYDLRLTIKKTFEFFKSLEPEI